MVLRADRLGSVLDDGQAVCMRDSRVGFHLGWQPEEVDRHDRPGSAGNGRFQLLRVQVVGFRINIDKYRLRLEASNAPSSRRLSPSTQAAARPNPRANRQPTRVAASAFSSLTCGPMMNCWLSS